MSFTRGVETSSRPGECRIAAATPLWPCARNAADAKPLKQAAQWVEEYRKFWEASLDRLAAYLEKNKPAAGQERKTVIDVPDLYRESGGIGVAGASSTGGLTAFALAKVLKKNKPTRTTK
jgi:hypothetical protein